MRLLLTGGAGFIGQHVLQVALAAGHDVLVLDNLRDDVHPEPAWDPPAGARFTRGDVRDADDCARALDGVEGVIHLAAKVGLGVDISDLPDYASSNDVGTAVLLAAMARSQVRSLVLAGSMVVYGEGRGQCPSHGQAAGAPRTADRLEAGEFEPLCEQCGRPLTPALVDEDTPADPRNAYAVSKLAQEHYATTWARETGSSATSLRFHNVYGPGMPRNTPYAGVASLFAAALRRGEAPRVFEDGGQRRDFVHVRDIASAVVAAAEQPSDGFRAYNVGSGTPRTVGDLAAELATALDGPSPVVTGQWRLGDVRHITADSARIREQLGWVPREDFATGIRELATGGTRPDTA